MVSEIYIYRNARYNNKKKDAFLATNMHQINFRNLQLMFSSLEALSKFLAQLYRILFGKPLGNKAIWKTSSEVGRTYLDEV